LRDDRGPARSQNVFLKFAGCSFGKLVEEGHAMGRLEMGQIRPGKFAKFFELVYSNDFNSPSMVGINSVTVG
jgi:hypothetical protein